MLTALAVIFALYYCLMIALIYGWQRAVTRPASMDEMPGQFVTVVIAARNEEASIGRLLEDFGRQQDNDFEVIVVDDHSDDNTAAVVKACAARVRYPLRLLDPGILHGKKDSISTGVQHARGALIATTDADCRVGTGWISSLRGCFRDPRTQFVSAGVRIRQDGTPGAALQSAEFVSLVGAGGAAIGAGYPVMCNGANMAFRKDAFIEVNGYEGNRHIASGDDEFLMRSIGARHPEGIRFCNEPRAVVETAAVPWRAFISQRIRWAGKWKYQTSAMTPALAVFVFLFHLSVVTLVPPSLTGGPAIPLMLLSVKAMLEYKFLSTVSRFLGVRWSWGAFGLLQIVYPLYAVAMGVLANVGSTTWKNRKIESRSMEMRSRLAGNR